MTISVAPPARPPDRTAQAPGSKYVANRLLLLAALAPGASRIEGAPRNEDIEAATAGLRALGVDIRERPGGVLIVGGTPDAWNERREPATVDVRESGTLLRFLAALAATLPFPVRLTGRGRIGERPMEELLRALEQLGARIDRYPLTVLSPALRGGRVAVATGESSQFASALLLASPRIKGGLDLELSGTPVSASYLELTASLLEQSGARVERTQGGYRTFGDRPRPGVHRVPADWTAASALFGAAAVTGGTIRVPNLDPQAVEGERRFPETLQRMGCRVEARGTTVSVTGSRPLRGVRTNMATMPDAAPTLAVVAALAAEGETRISGVAHLRHKESDRIAALADGLRRLGAGVEVGEDSLAIRPGDALRTPPERLDSRRDHRIAMAFALAGLVVPGGVRITHPDAVRKSFPGFWDALRDLGAQAS